MAERGHRVYATQTLRVSKRIEAPLAYVYAWATDFREDDGRLSRRRPRPRFRVVRLSPRRTLRIRFSGPSSKDPRIAVDVIRFDPPNAWHTDQIDEEDRMALDYRLTALTSRATRIDLFVTERWVVPDYPSRTEVRRRVRASWDHLAALIEDDYRKGRPARGR